jgi:hypothetical protein
MKKPVLSFLMLILAALALAQAAPVTLPAPAPVPDLKLYAAELQQKLDHIDQNLAALVADHEGKLASSKEIRGFLAACREKVPEARTASFIDPVGVLRYIEPMEYEAFEGADLTGQAHIKGMIKGQKPVLSGAFKSVEGFVGVVVGHPLFEDGLLIGFVTLLFEPAAIVEPVLDEIGLPEGFELWMMQPDGMQVYDKDTREIGLNLLTDPLYKDFPSLIEFAKKAGAEPSGESKYSFFAAGTEKKITKDAVWTTIGLHGMPWRVIMVKQMN